MLQLNEVLDIVEGMDKDFKTLRDEARRRYDLYALRKDPYVTEEVAREGKVRMLSPLLIHAAQTIRSDMMMNPTEFNVIPLMRENGSIPVKQQGLAENLERSLAVAWGRLNEGRRLDRDLIWHQLVSPFGIMILEFNEYAQPEQPDWMDDESYLSLVEAYKREWLPWHIYMPDPMSCSWMERDGRPVVFCRKYRLLMRDIEQLYSKREGSPAPDQLLRYDGGKVKFVSDDYSPDRSNYKAGFFEVEMGWLDDGDKIYHYAMNPDGEGGQLLWTDNNPTGRPTAFVVPGNTTPARLMHDKYEPFLWPLMQAVSQMNDLRSMRATAARNIAGPRTYVPMDPEVVKAYALKGESLPTAVRWKKGETPYLLGKNEPYPTGLDQDWDKLEQALNVDLQMFLPSPFVHIVDPAVLKAATATSILHAAETGLRIYGPLMQAKDAAVRDICEAMIASIRTRYKDIPLQLAATGEEMSRGKNLKEGSTYELTQKDVNFAFKLMVKSRGMSQAQAAAQYDLVLRQWVLPDGSKGPATREDLIDAANYTDSRAQIKKLAKESILDSINPWIEEQAIMAAHTEILLESGIDLPLGRPGMGPPAEQPSGIPNSGQRMDAPQVTSPNGGSDATAFAGGQ